MGPAAAHLDGGAVPALGFGHQERPQEVGRVPALGPSGQHHLFDLLADVFEPEPPAQGDDLVDGDGAALAHDRASGFVLL